MPNRIVTVNVMDLKEQSKEEDKMARNAISSQCNILYVFTFGLSLKDVAI